jgi:phosphoribosylglycinamide formyltransferase-1
MARLGILLSGSGSTYANLADRIADGTLAAEIAVVVASRADAGGIERAKQRGHPVVVAREAAAVTAALRAHRAEFVAMCGYMRFWDPPGEFAGKTVNVHPALLPAFGGKGMYGHHAHEAVIAAGCKISGCTVHLVAGDYDRGPIIAQRAVPVLDSDDADALAARVQAAERAVYPGAIAALMAGRVRVVGGRCVVDGGIG